MATDSITAAGVPGELAVRRRAGFDRPGYSGPSRSRRIPPIAARFLTEQPMVVVGAADGAGRLWASQLTGPPGFLRAEPGAATEPGAAAAEAVTEAADAVTVAARPAAGDPLAAVLGGPAAVGLIALQPARRRRMRMNGRSLPSGSGIRVTLDEVFSNCPKYIQGREPWVEPNSTPGPALRTGELTAEQQRLIHRADTFFVSTANRRGDVDASHRGGNPGFVQLLDANRLRWPDYQGNAMFCTLGNLAEHPAAGLLFIDWASGDTLQLTGSARTDWDQRHAGELPGAQRVVEFTVTEVVATARASGLRWTRAEYSKFNPPAPEGR
ncbi:pyridoxamine 5'-phosphate oxidase family protein [Kitasatospora sp. NBC_01287]|uniref:pyridoxamine 5'-phosphate oxidase family protein n=1 Tax=Kitasatospora sp. NBC_01287 TaxID=2903573 RepID=UPI00224E0443|nr:pyridoxamine 5'-phosphate oxidase family protein [Kitasatospora sp. NBC_01287]MCX4745560.1 pyridoxamine 5'-phosphate oxidase family protein [Kitasatospora sp. NBC_01287]